MDPEVFINAVRQAKQLVSDIQHSAKDDLNHPSSPSSLPHHHQLACSIVLCACYESHRSIDDGENEDERFFIEQSSITVDESIRGKLSNYHPNSLDHIRSKLLDGSYRSVREFYVDLKRVYSLAALVAKSRPEVWSSAQRMDSYTDDVWMTVVSLQAEQAENGLLTDPIPSLDELFDLESTVLQRPICLYDSDLETVLGYLEDELGSEQIPSRSTTVPEPSKPVVVSDSKGVDVTEGVSNQNTPQSINPKPTCDDQTGDTGSNTRADDGDPDTEATCHSNRGKRKHDQLLIEDDTLTEEFLKNTLGDEGLSTTDGSAKRLKTPDGFGSEDGWIPGNDQIKPEVHARLVTELFLKFLRSAEPRGLSNIKRLFELMNNHAQKKPYDSIRSLDRNIFKLIDHLKDTEKHSITDKSIINDQAQQPSLSILSQVYIIQRIYFEFHKLNFRLTKPDQKELNDENIEGSSNDDHDKIISRRGSLDGSAEQENLNILSELLHSILKQEPNEIKPENTDSDIQTSSAALIKIPPSSASNKTIEQSSSRALNSTDTGSSSDLANPSDCSNTNLTATQSNTCIEGDVLLSGKDDEQGGSRGVEGSLRFKDLWFRVGDFVEIFDRRRIDRPIVGRIVKLWSCNRRRRRKKKKRRRGKTAGIERKIEGEVEMCSIDDETVDEVEDVVLEEEVFEEERCLTICRYLRYEDVSELSGRGSTDVDGDSIRGSGMIGTGHKAGSVESRGVIVDEVFKTSVVMSFPIDSTVIVVREFVNRCAVLSLEDYLKGRPSSKDIKSVYVCRSGFNQVLKRFIDDDTINRNSYRTSDLKLFKSPLRVEDLKLYDDQNISASRQSQPELQGDEISNGNGSSERTDKALASAGQILSDNSTPEIRPLGVIKRASLPPGSTESNLTVHKHGSLYLTGLNNIDDPGVTLRRQSMSNISQEVIFSPSRTNHLRTPSSTSFSTHGYNFPSNQTYHQLSEPPHPPTQNLSLPITELSHSPQSQHHFVAQQPSHVNWFPQGSQKATGYTQQSLAVNKHPTINSFSPPMQTHVMHNGNRISQIQNSQPTSQQNQPMMNAIRSGVVSQVVGNSGLQNPTNHSQPLPVDQNAMNHQMVTTPTSAVFNGTNNILLSTGSNNPTNQTPPGGGGKMVARKVELGSKEISMLLNMSEQMRLESWIMMTLERANREEDQIDASAIFKKYERFCERHKLNIVEIKKFFETINKVFNTQPQSNLGGNITVKFLTRGSGGAGSGGNHVAITGLRYKTMYVPQQQQAQPHNQQVVLNINDGTEHDRETGSADGMIVVSGNFQSPVIDQHQATPVVQQATIPSLQSNSSSSNCNHSNVGNEGVSSVGTQKEDELSLKVNRLSQEVEMLRRESLMKDEIILGIRNEISNLRDDFVGFRERFGG
ncbi:hypothetical protein BY996DRAFT_6420977 [Phakopsora pachyrhizi]|nr:hypothetical protein BY996DRAFT_6420977 [Phakopsora pachyrhizi]